MRPGLRVLAGCGLIALGLAVPVNATASVQIFSFDAQPSTSQAGAHPDLGFSFELSNHDLTGQELSPCACNDPKDVTVHTPAGVIGNPHATPQCSVAEFASDECPVDSQVGVVEIALADGKKGEGFFGRADLVAPVYNLIPPPEEAGLLGFKSGLGIDSPSFEVLSSRTNSDYGLDAATVDIEHFAPLWQVRQVLWGVPADPAHDYLRFARGEAAFQSLGEARGRIMLCDPDLNESTDDPASVFQLCPLGSFMGGPVAGIEVSNGKLVGHPLASSSPLTPFTQNPTTCGISSLETSLSVLAYDKGESSAESSWPATTDCDQLAFNPSLFARPTTTQTDSPSGIDVDLKAPSFESPETPSPSEIRAAIVTLPPGFTINPNAADGKTACAESQALFGTTVEAQCPQFAKIGTLEVHSPALPGVLPGAVYIGEPKPGERYRLILAFDGFGVHVKLSGTVHPDPSTGQLVTEFTNLPQFPFEDFDLHFFGSESGILATPTQCGTYPVTTVFEPWDAALPNQTSTQFFALDEGPEGGPCPHGARPFAPVIRAASASNTSASHTSFSIDLTRQDGEQNLTGLTIVTPPGFSATLNGIPYCPESAIASAAAPGYAGLAEQVDPSCPAGSQIGEATAGAGAGTHPYYAPGKVYLAGPYKGAPLSLAVITPAVSGPYDLGNVVVRAALRVNPETARVSAISDPLPQILEGIPLRLRSILIDLNRPNFALNPTNCEPLPIEARVTGTEGAVAQPTLPFQVANCARLPFAPQLSMGFSGSTDHGGNPSLHTTLSNPGGSPDANISRVAVTLPPTELIDNAHLQNPCTRVQFAQGSTPGEDCPSGSVIGSAKAQTPLLEKPLEGPVYLRSDPENKSGLPDIVAALNGQIDITLDGKVSTVHKAIRTTFEAVPDAPVSNFTLNLDGGRRGLLQNNTSLCLHPLHAAVDISGQNGKTANQDPLLRTPCGNQGQRRASVLRAVPINGVGGGR